MQEIINYHNGSSWRRLDYIRLIERPALNIDLHNNPDVEWSEQGQYFLIKQMTKTDTFLRLMDL